MKKITASLEYDGIPFSNTIDQNPNYLKLLNLAMDQLGILFKQTVNMLSLIKAGPAELDNMLTL